MLSGLRLVEIVLGGRQAQPFLLGVLEPLNRGCVILPRDRTGRVGQNHHLLDRVGAEGVERVPHGVEQAVVIRLAGPHHFVSLFDGVDEIGIELGGRVFRVRHFGADGAVVFGIDVAALGHEVDGRLAVRSPILNGFHELGYDACAGGSDEAVWWPDDEGITSGGGESFDVLLHSGVKGWNGGGPDALLEIGKLDEGEWGRMLAFGVLPEKRVGDIHQVVAVEGNVDIRKFVAEPPDETGETFHIFVRAWNVEGTRVDALVSSGWGTKIHLWVDGDQVNLLH